MYYMKVACGAGSFESITARIDWTRTGELALPVRSQPIKNSRLYGESAIFRHFKPESATGTWNVQRQCLCHLRGFGENVRVFLGQCLERELRHVGVLLVG